MAVKKKTPAKKKEERKKNAPVIEVVRGEKAPRKPSGKISKAQKFQLDVIARTNFNMCNGEMVVELLKKNRRMWRSAYMPLNSISLRDMEDDCWHADTLYIYAEEGWQFQLEELVREQFKADEIYWVGGSGAVDMLGTSEIKDKTQVILSVWWD